MSESAVRTPEAVQAEIKKTRHKAELPLYAISIILGVIAVIIAGIYVFQDSGLLDGLKGVLQENNITDASPEFNQVLLVLIGFISLIGGIGCLLYFIIANLIGYYQLYSKELSYSVRVSEKNFPELYAYVKEFTRLLGLKKEPEVYIQSTGVINACACWVPGKYYVRINAEVLDLAYLEHKDIDTVAFVMAHEFGHIYFHHVHMLYKIWTAFIGFVPVFGPSFMVPIYTRAKEYSADRVAQALMDGKNKEECMMLLATGRHLYKYTSVEDYLKVINKDHNFIERFARFVVNMLASHPITPFRTAAMMDESKKSGRLL